MRFYTITLAAADTPATLKSLIEASLQDSTDSANLAMFQRKYKQIARIAIYAEVGNDNGASGPARVGRGTGMGTVDRVAADAGATDDAVANGFPLIPGILESDLFGAVGAAGVYSTEDIYISGAIGDTFQLGIVTI